MTKEIKNRRRIKAEEIEVYYGILVASEKSVHVIEWAFNEKRVSTARNDVIYDTTPLTH